MHWWQVLRSLFTSPYHDHLYFSTTRPIKEIVECQHDKQAVREKLVDFRLRKEHEFRFVSLAVNRVKGPIHIADINLL